MAWIGGRQTTREEDMAYSLFGIFDVQIPILYGEGREKEFKRLWKEVDGVLMSEHPQIPITNDAAFDSPAEDPNARCHPDTRVNLLDQIQAWADDPHGEC